MNPRKIKVLLFGKLGYAKRMLDARAIRAIAYATLGAR
jgi:hypothetical protein